MVGGGEWEMLLLSSNGWLPISFGNDTDADF
jgi:hypothetical protein